MRAYIYSYTNTNDNNNYESNGMSKNNSGDKQYET